MLFFRLHALDSVVDFFVIAEAAETFTGPKKKLLFKENRRQSAHLKKEF